MFLETYEKWDKQIVRTYFIGVAVLCIAEILVSIALRNAGVVTGNMKLYVRDYVVFPTGMNFLFVLLTKFIVDSEVISIKVKNYAVVLCLDAMVFIVTSIHGYFLVLTTAFIGPIIVSVIFNDLVVTRITSMISIVLMFVSLYTSQVFDETWARDVRMLNFAVSMAVALVFYAIAKVVVKSNVEKMDELVRATKEKAHLTERLKIDLQTGLYNHVEFHSSLNRAVDACAKTHTKYCLAIIDIDDFKRINDTYGHDKGDIVIGRVATRLHEMTSIRCKAFRYGGEEFAILFLDERKSQVAAELDELRRKLMCEEYSFMPGGHITISGGIYEFGWNCPDAESIFNYADQSLYQAKMNGKNQIGVHM